MRRPIGERQYLFADEVARRLGMQYSDRESLRKRQGETLPAIALHARAGTPDELS